MEKQEQTRWLEDMIMDVPMLVNLDFDNEMATVTLVDCLTKTPLLFPVEPHSRYAAMYVFSSLEQQAVEQFIESLYEDGLVRRVVQIWQVTKRQIGKAMLKPGVTVYLDLPQHVARYTRENCVG